MLFARRLTVYWKGISHHQTRLSTERGSTITRREHHRVWILFSAIGSKNKECREVIHQYHEFSTMYLPKNHYFPLKWVTAPIFFGASCNMFFRCSFVSHNSRQKNARGFFAGKLFRDGKRWWHFCHDYQASLGIWYMPSPSISCLHECCPANKPNTPGVKQLAPFTR